MDLTVPFPVRTLTVSTVTWRRAPARIVKPGTKVSDVSQVNIVL